MTADKLYTSLTANTIMAKLTNHFQQTRLITPSTHKHYHLALKSVIMQQELFSELPSPRRSHYTNYWYSWVQTIYYVMFWFVFIFANFQPKRKLSIRVQSSVILLQLVISMSTPGFRAFIIDGGDMAWTNSKTWLPDVEFLSATSGAIFFC